mgnify:CR=1 FL=1
MVGRFGQAELCILMDIGEQTDPTGRSDYKVQKAFDGIEIGYDGRDFRFQEIDGSAKGGIVIFLKKGKRLMSGALQILFSSFGVAPFRELCPVRIKF